MDLIHPNVVKLMHYEEDENFLQENNGEFPQKIFIAEIDRECSADHLYMCFDRSKIKIT